MGKDIVNGAGITKQSPAADKKKRGEHDPKCKYNAEVVDQQCSNTYIYIKIVISNFYLKSEMFHIEVEFEFTYVYILFPR